MCLGQGCSSFRGGSLKVKNNKFFFHSSRNQPICIHRPESPPPSQPPNPPLPLTIISCYQQEEVNDNTYEIPMLEYEEIKSGYIVG